MAAFATTSLTTENLELPYLSERERREENTNREVNLDFSHVFIFDLQFPGRHVMVGEGENINPGAV